MSGSFPLNSRLYTLAECAAGRAGRLDMRFRTKEGKRVSRKDARTQRDALRGQGMGLTVSLVTPGRTGVGVGVRRRGIVRSPVGDEEGIAAGAETRGLPGDIAGGRRGRSEEHTSELQS